MLGAYALTLVRHAPRELYGPSRLMAAAAIVIAVLLVVRAVVALASPPMASALESSLVNVLVYFCSALAQLALGLGCYFMLMIRRNAALKALSATDPLTGSLNRRGLDVATSRAEHDFRRTWTVYSVIALDLDHFKRVNDTYGHAAGDVVLQRLATECRSKLRGDSVVARLGGEEFCILLPGCKCEDAQTVAERIRVAFADAPIESGQAVIRCTVSMGVAQCHADAADFATVCKDADAALYRAKNGGRNRVETCPTPVDARGPG
jgi:diguanylate cyclase (GGDEF)-like protein